MTTYSILSLIGCPPPANANRPPAIVISNGITRLNYNWSGLPGPGVYYSETPSDHNSWFTESGAVVPNLPFNPSGERLTQYWEKNRVFVPTNKGKALVEKFKEVLPEENE